MPSQTINFDHFHADLMRTTEFNGSIIQETILHGAESLGSDFTVVTSRDKTALISLSVKDGWKPASDNFEGKNVVDVRSRFVSFKEADIDIEFTLSDIKKIYQTYLGWMKTPGRTLSEVNANPFELFFLRHVIASHFEFVRLQTAWQGVHNAAGAGALSLTDGFITKFTNGRSVSGDILASHVFDGTALTNANAYDQFNGVADLVATVRPKMLVEDLNVYCSQTAYDKYRKNRRTLFKEHVGPADRPTVLDDYSNMRFVQDPGLAGKDTIAITPKKNLVFVANEDPGAYAMNIIKQIKSWQITIRASLDFDYASPDWIFLNDLI